MLIYTFATLATVAKDENGKEAEHAGDARRIDDHNLDITISLRSGELDAPRIILNIVTL